MMAPAFERLFFVKGVLLVVLGALILKTLNMLRYFKDDHAGVYGQYVSCDELYSELIKDQPFFNQKLIDIDLGQLPGGLRHWSLC